MPRRALLLGLQTGGLLFLLLVGVALLTFTTYERAEHADANALLRQVSRKATVADVPAGIWATRVAGSGRASSGPAPDGLPVEADLDAVSRDGRARQREVALRSGSWFVRTSPRGDGVVQVALDRTAAEQASGRVVRSLLLSGLVGVACAGALSVHLAHRAMAPIEEALRQQRRFVADAGHELRTPLTLLSTRTQLLARRLGRQEAPAELQRDLDGLRADAAALSDVLEELLVAADRRAVMDRAPCDLATLVADCADTVHAEAAARSITLEVAPAATASASVSATAVRRAVLSLLDNALDHAHSRVQVQVREHRRSVDVEVADDGPGVPAAQRERVFERFAGARTAEPGVGRRHYGLGLALVAEVADTHGGSVSVGPRDDGASGARFVLRLPRSA